MPSKFIEPMEFDANPDGKHRVGADENNLIKAMDFDVRTKSIEEKIYIILYKIDDSGTDDIYNNIYTICLGRTDAYQDIKNKLISGLSVDIHRSRIMTETKQTESQSGDRKYYMVPYDECISVYSFMTSVQEYYSDDDFDIEEYNDSEIPESEENDLSNNPRYLTAEQQEYRKMLEASMKRDKFLHTIAAEMSKNSGNI